MNDNTPQSQGMEHSKDIPIETSILRHSDPQQAYPRVISHPKIGVPVHLHADLMRDRWVKHGNTVTVPLIETWRGICDTLNLKLRGLGRPEQTDWHVCCPATGTGKTESLIVYASLFPKHVTHTGMLIVTRLKATADEMRDSINELSGSIVAVSCHTDNEVPEGDLKLSPITVITHAAFTRALEWSGTRRSKWEQFTRFGEYGSRGLIVIDEAIDLLNISRLTEDELAHLIGNIKRPVRERFPAAVKYLEDLLASLRAWIDHIKGLPKVTSCIYQTDEQATFKRLFQEMPNFAEFSDFMQSQRYAGSARRGSHNDVNSYLAKEQARIINDVAALAQHFMMYHKSGKRSTFNTAHSILPDDAHGCVVLDATAQTNKLYDVMTRDDGLTVAVHRPPAGARSYRNLQVKVARVDATGKGYMTGTDEEGKSIGEQEAQRLLDWMAEGINPQQHKEVFLACHLDNEHYFAGAELDFALKTAHYGAIDGRNDFRDCTAAVIFGLPFRDPVDASLSFFALQGVQSDEWLRDETRRQFNEYQDIKQELWHGWTVTSLVQTVNRIATRRVINGHGDCPPCELFLMLPKGKNGDIILRRLMEQLPDAPMPLPWDFATVTERKPKKRKRNHRDVLKVFIQNMAEGAKWPATGIAKELGISVPRWKELTAELRNDATELAAVMRGRGVTYDTERKGSRTIAYLARKQAA